MSQSSSRGGGPMIQCANPANEAILIYLQKEEIKLRRQNQQNRMFAFMRAGKSVKAATHVLSDGAACAKLHGIGALLSSQIELGVFGACERLSQQDSISRSRSNASSSSRDNDPPVPTIPPPIKQPPKPKCSFRKGKMVWSVLALMGIHHEVTNNQENATASITCEQLSARLILFQDHAVLTCALTGTAVLSAIRTLQTRKLVKTIDKEMALHSMLSQSTNGRAHIAAPKLRWVFTTEGLTLATAAVLPNLDEKEVLIDEYRRTLPARATSGSSTTNERCSSSATAFDISAPALASKMQAPSKRTNRHSATTSTSSANTNGGAHAIIDLLDDDDDDDEDDNTTVAIATRKTKRAHKRQRVDSSLPPPSNTTISRSTNVSQSTREPPSGVVELNDVTVTPVAVPKAWTRAKAQFEKFGSTPFDTQRGQSAYNVTSPLRSGEWEAVLLLDTREVFGHGQGKSLLHSRLMDQRINTVVRPLPLGDMLWIIRRFDAASGKHVEYVHDVIVERKGQHDLCTSIKDGRWLEQKRRLALSGLKKVVYVVEGTWTINDNMPLASFNKTLAKCHVDDEFMLRCTADVSDTVAFLGAMHAMIRASTTHNPSWRGPEVNKWWTYAEFKVSCGKSLAPTLSDMFGMQLKQVDRMGTTSALVVVEQFGTPAGLVRVLKAMQKEQAIQMLAALAKEGGRAIGPKLAGELYELYGPGR